MAFLVGAGLLFTQVNTMVILAFLEYLLENSFNPENIANYLAAIRAMFITYSLPTEPLRDEKIQMFVKSVKINKRFTPVIPTFVTEGILRDIVAECDQLYAVIVFIIIFCIFYLP